MARNKILFIDDEKTCHVLAEIIINNFTPYKIMKAFSGTEALDLLERFEDQICLVVSDIMLPDISGFDIFKAIDGRLPFIFQSGLENQQAQIKHQFKEDIPIIQKPYQQQQLIDQINLHALSIA